MSESVILINRAPVLTLWAAVVAERLGYDPGAALSLGKALAGLNAQSKGRRLGIYKPSEKAERVPGEKARAGEGVWVELLGRGISARRTPEGIRALDKDKPVDPESVERYLEEKFGTALDDVRKAMRTLARAFPPGELNTRGFSLYERFRPAIPEGVRGWGAKGELSLSAIRAIARRSEMKASKRALFFGLGLLLLVPACSRSNNLLFGRVQAIVGGHKVIVTDCYRVKVPKPMRLEDTAEGAPSYRFTPCRDADVLISGEELSVNGASYGRLNAGDTVSVDHGRVLVNGRETSSREP
jgi:hypothetical protein